MKTNCKVCTLGVAVAFSLFSFAGKTNAGTGTIDIASKTIDLNVLFTYSETDDNLDGTANPSWKAVFSKASERLWNATNGQLRIGTVTVYRRALDKKDDADIWISPTGTRAYATDVGVLGVSGQHMQFYGSLHRNLSSYRGDCSIVHEMGHYVFGLWDEYIGGSVPLALKDTYVDSDVRDEGQNANFYSISPSDTVASLMDAGGGVPGKNLRTEFDTASNIVKGVASGGRWYVNKQYLLRKESCWETMSRLEFGGVRVFQTIPTGASPNTPPPGFVDITWKKVPTLSRLVLCIDRSGSMADDNKMELAKTGASIFVNLTQESHTYTVTNSKGQAEDKVVVDGDQLGAVDFDDAVTTDLPLTLVDAAGTAKDSARGVIGGLFARNSTAIGDGLQRSLDLITAAGDKASQEAVILLSDGFDNASTIPPATAAANCAARGARVFSIALGSDADAGTLGNIALISNGKFYQATDALGLLLIYPSIFAELKGGGLLGAIGSFLPEADSAISQVAVDDFTEEITFSLSSVDTGFKFSIKSPDGHLYSASAPIAGIRFEQSATEQHYRVSNPKAGNWQLIVKAPVDGSSSNFQYSLTSTTASQGVNVSASTAQSDYVFPDPIVIQCTVTAGDPVAGAQVTGKVTGPNGIVSGIILYDDGLAVHGDETAGDGVYSASFVPLSGNGVYAFDITVENKTGVQGIINPEETTTKFVPHAILPFQRTTSATVNVTNAPVARTEWLRVDALDVQKNAKMPSLCTVKLSAELNAPNATFTPATTPFSVQVGGPGGVQIAINPEDLVPTNKAGVYTIRRKSGKLNGTLNLQIGGSSRSRIVLTETGVSVGSLSFASPVTVELSEGTFDETVSLDPTTSPHVNPSRLSYAAKKNFANTPTLFLDGLKASLNHSNLNKDTLRIVSTFEGAGQDYDPASQDAVAMLGKLSLTIPKGTLKKNNNQIAKGELKIGAGTAQITFDLQRHIFTLNGAKLELDGLFDKTMSISLNVGSFDQSGVLTVQETSKGVTETFLY